MTPGLLYTLTSITDPSLKSTTYNTWYSTVHIPELMSIANGPSRAHRYKSTNPTQRWQFLALYPLADIAFTRPPEIAARVSSYHPVLPDGKSIWELIELEERDYLFAGRYYGYRKVECDKARWIVTLETDASELPKYMLAANGDTYLEEVRYTQYSIHRAPTTMAGVNSPQFHVPEELMIFELDSDMSRGLLRRCMRGYRAIRCNCRFGSLFSTSIRLKRRLPR